MFGIGPTELIVILVIALLVLGPKRLPELAAGLGKGLAEFRRATADINAELDEARRAVEEPAREAARAARPTDTRRVSRTTRPGSPMETAAQEAADARDEDGEKSGADAEGDAGTSTTGDPKASA
ncbi:MAG: twin-arginine translocase TatA/TatE family subunit [Candidatus Binatia bacterium]